MLKQKFKLLDYESPVCFSREFVLLDPWPNEDKGNFRVSEEFWVMWLQGGLEYRVRVPKGYKTDIASVPRLAWSLTGITKDGLQRNAAIIHDVLYMWQGQLPYGWFQSRLIGQEDWQDCSYLVWSKSDCDGMFLRLMLASDVSTIKRSVMYNAVRFGGYLAWIRTDTTREVWRDYFRNH